MIYSNINNIHTKLFNNYYGLMYGQQISTSTKDYTTYNSRKVSDYDIIVFTVEDGGILRNCIVIPASSFKEFGNLQIDYSIGSSERWCEFRYADETSINVHGKSDKTQYAFVYGYRISSRS